MIVFISDLHMSDGTAGINNISPRAFTLALHSIGEHAKNAQAEQITLVFLGDVFDLIRTERWFDFDPAERPWGEAPSVDRALEVLNGVIEKNPEVFGEILPSDYTETFGFPVNPRRIYVPGNHDRLCNLHPALRARVRETLGIAPSPDPFPNYFVDLDHAVFARHGHEWDPFNFEASEPLPAEGWQDIPAGDYASTPIGDLLACEFASQIPIAVLRNVPVTHPRRQELGDRLRDLFDVRPLGGMVLWLAFQSERFDDPTITDAINQGVRELVDYFRAIPFVQQWLGKHESFLHPSMVGLEVDLLIQVLGNCKFSTLQKALPLAQKLSGLFHGDNFAGKAADDFDRLDNHPDHPEWKNRILHVLYGHTHQPEQQAVATLRTPAGDRDRVYLNTGMWRPSHDQAIRGGFVTWKNLTYTIVYNDTECASSTSGAQFPTFEVWSGALKDE